MCSAPPSRACTHTQTHARTHAHPRTCTPAHLHTCTPARACTQGNFRYFHFHPDGGERTIKHDDVVHIKSVSKSSVIATGIVAKTEGNRQQRNQNQQYNVRVKVSSTVPATVDFHRLESHPPASGAIDGRRYTSIYIDEPCCPVARGAKYSPVAFRCQPSRRSCRCTLSAVLDRSPRPIESIR